MTITLSSNFVWGAIAGTTYRVQVRDAVNAPVAISDSVTNDPDGNGFVETTVNLVPVSIWLVGKPLGTYKFFVSAIDSNGNVGPEVQLNGDYAAPVIDSSTLTFE